MNGRHPLLPSGGAAVDVDAPAGEARALADRWLAAARPTTASLGLGPLVCRVKGDHVSLCLASPPDLRDQAAAVLDRAIGADPEARLDQAPRPVLRACLEVAAAAGIPAFFDERGLTVGVGARSRTWPLDDLPTPAALAGAARVPFALVSGTNGKTTTANLIGAIGDASGRRAGVANSNGIRIAGAFVERGDWSGPGAARRLLRDPEVTFVVLETARGGLMRRGLAVDGADVVVLTNVSEDHLGEWGLEDVDDLAWAKATLALSLRPGGTVVSHADDPALERALAPVLQRRPDLRHTRFSSRRRADAWLDGETLRLGPEALMPVGEVPLTFGGAALYNVENALAAALAGEALGMGRAAIVAGLSAVRPEPAHVRGRSNLFRLRGARILVDYAHNPDGLDRLRDLADRLAPARRFLLLGQAGDRPDPLVHALGAAAARLRCDRYVLKPLPGYARGRAPDEVVAELRRGLVAQGVPEDRIEVVPDELTGVQRLLDALGPDDLALLLVHEDLDGALARIAAAGGAPGP